MKEVTEGSSWLKLFKFSNDDLIELLISKLFTSFFSTNSNSKISSLEFKSASVSYTHLTLPTMRTV